MPSLTDVLANDSLKPNLVKDACELIDSEVKDKGGLSGITIKAAYAVVKGIKPGFVEGAVSDLLPDFAKALDPLAAEAQSGGKPVSAFFESNAGRVADALLSITDAKAAKAKNNVAKGAYDKLRGAAKKNVEQAVPRLAKMVEKYAT